MLNPPTAFLQRTVQLLRTNVSEQARPRRHHASHHLYSYEAPLAPSGDEVLPEPTTVRRYLVSSHCVSDSPNSPGMSRKSNVRSLSKRLPRPILQSQNPTSAVAQIFLLRRHTLQYTTSKGVPRTYSLVLQVVISAGGSGPELPESLTVILLRYHRCSRACVPSPFLSFFEALPRACNSFSKPHSLVPAWLVLGSNLGDGKGFPESGVQRSLEMDNEHNAPSSTEQLLYYFLLPQFLHGNGCDLPEEELGCQAFEIVAPQNRMSSLDPRTQLVQV